MSKQTEVKRRTFLQKGAGAGTTPAALRGISFIIGPERVSGAKDRIRFG